MSLAIGQLDRRYVLSREVGQDGALIQRSDRYVTDDQAIVSDNESGQVERATQQTVTHDNRVASITQADRDGFEL
jgi:hypothetical protein